MANLIDMVNEKIKNDDTFISQGNRQAELSQQREFEKRVEDEANKKQNLFGANDLRSYVHTAWQAAREAKTDVHKKLYEASLQRKGEYTSEKLTQIKKTGGSEIFMKLTSIKCRALESWIRDVLSPFGDAIWTIKPTPIPDLSPDQISYIDQFVQMQLQTNPQLVSTMETEQELKEYLQRKTIIKNNEKAETACRRMETKIADQLAEANWREELEKVISDITTYKAGFLKGPMLIRSDTNKWQQNIETGKWEVIRNESLTVQYKRVSPFDIYPAPYSSTIEDGYLIEHHTMTRSDLNKLIGVGGFDESSIRTVLQKYGTGGLKDWIWEQDMKEEAEHGKDNFVTNSPDNTIDALEFWGHCPGRLLSDWGVNGVEDPDKDYQVNIWLIGEYIIKAVINPSPLGRKPYHKASFESTPGSFWGMGVPEVMEDIQNVCNATARALVNNMGISSGPQVAIDVAQLSPSQDIKAMWPWKIWAIDTSAGNAFRSNNKPMEFFQPDSNANELMAVYTTFAKMADEYTGIPAYAYGMTSNIGSIGSTATGFSMLLANASKGVKFVLSNIDTNIIEPSIRDLYDFNMMYGDDDSIKADLRVVARGTLSLVEKEHQQSRRVDFLTTMGNSPQLMDIAGKRGLANLLREVVKSLELPMDDIIPSEEEIEASDMQKQMMAQTQALVDALATGQVTPEQLMLQLMQIYPPQQAAQNGGGGAQIGSGQSNNMYSENRGTLPASPERTVDGRNLGGVDNSLFVNRPQ